MNSETHRSTAGGIYSIGHSNHSLEHFIKLLKQHGIRIVADVRTTPFSRFNQHFNRELLASTLEQAGITYQFHGNTLGGRPDGLHFYDADGHVRYDLLSKSPDFQKGVEGLKQASISQRTAMLCSEGDPAQCHRHLLISRVLNQKGLEVIHILQDGSLEPYESIALSTATQANLFDEGEEESSWRSPLSVLRNTQPNRSSHD